MSVESRTKILSELEDNVERLVLQAEELAGRVVILERENTMLQGELSKARVLLSASEEGRRIQSAAAALGATHADSREAKKLISQVLREIESCISLLQT